MQDLETKFLPWLAALPEEERLEVEDLLLQIMAAVMDRKFRDRVSQSASPVLAGVNQPGLN